jgi:ribonucleoside-diphosphate reductase alpha chain
MVGKNDFSMRIFKERYALNHDETWEDACRRVARVVAAAENNGKIKECEEVFWNELVNNRFMPGGRIWYGSGRPRGQLLNCFCLPTSDSREGWGKTVSDSIVVSGMGGGIGINFSPIRPRGSVIRGHSGTATGAVSLMEIINAAGDVIRAGGGRRTALMLCLNHDHPDIPEFLDKKLDLKKLTNANVSVVFMNEDPTKFLKRVERDELHEFMWNNQVVKTIPARELWKKILDNAVACGEPGILNGWLWNQQNNIYYSHPCISTNPCGEIPLEAYGCCDLGALVLPRFVVNGELDRRSLARTIAIAVRFLDNVLDVNTYPLKEIEENCKQVRRIGLGVMGLHDMLVLLGKKYTSDDGKATVDDVFRFIKKKAYEASIDLAIEKGQFPALNRGKFVESGFCQKNLSIGIRERILRNGIRNCALLTCAPTGTTSIVSNVTSGIEPLYAFAYRRRFRSGDRLEEEIIEHQPFADLRDTGDPRVRLYESALEISVKDHLEIQAICQRHVDNAISKTINLPKSYTGEDLDPILRKHIGQLKGVTLYRDSSRGKSPIEPLDMEEALRLQCTKGTCEF